MDLVVLNDVVAEWVPEQNVIWITFFIFNFFGNLVEGIQKKV